MSTESLEQYVDENFPLIHNRCPDFILEPALTLHFHNFYVLNALFSCFLESICELHLSPLGQQSMSYVSLNIC